MKEITRKSRMRRFGAKHTMIANRGRNVKVEYASPKDNNDYKRWGREMSITIGATTMRLNGRAINAVKSVLEKAGEVYL